MTHEAYKAFLRRSATSCPKAGLRDRHHNVDPEIADLPGPQLVVPITNARYALNAANARWGRSMTRSTAPTPWASPRRPGRLRPGRGARVVARARVFPGRGLPAGMARPRRRPALHVQNGASGGRPADGAREVRGLRGHPGARRGRAAQQRAACRTGDRPRASDRQRATRRGCADVRLESAVSAIMDCEDSVACVDAEDKVLAYGNWLGLMKGDLTESGSTRAARPSPARLAPDLEFTAPDGSPLVAQGPALMLVRNVGHLMTNPAVLDRDGNEASRGCWTRWSPRSARCTTWEDDGPRNSTPGRSMWSSPRCTAPRRSPSPTHLHPCRGRAGPAAPHREAGHHGRGTAHQRQPQGMHPRGEAPGRLHQHRLPGPDRRRDPHLDGGRADDPARAR
jgi:malate synthase